MRRSRLLAWLFPDRAAPPSWRAVHARSLVLLGDRVEALDQQVQRLREAEERSTAAAVVAELRAEQLERELAALRAEAGGLRADLCAVREELLWSFAERRAAVEPPRTVDLTRPVAGSA